MTDAQSKINDAARWLASQTETQPNILILLRDKFDISAVQAAKACSLATGFRRATVQTGGRH
ncbi:hypothetical protein C3Y89_26625 [Rhizobium sp. UPM1132]|jgi:hypothetical protein|nr:hypothetical protein [Rhizobium ruizarguesonis]